MSEWGNPANVSFEKRYVRTVMVDHHRIRTHLHLAPLVERIILDLAEQRFTAQVTGWVSGEDGRTIRLSVDDVDPSATEKVMLRYGFASTGDGEFRWDQDSPPVVAETPQEPPRTPKAAVLTPSDPEVVSKALEGSEHRLGSRPLAPGDVGRDVLALQVFLGVTRTAVYDSELTEAVKEFHRRKGFQCDGTMTLAAMRWIIPSTTERLRPGASGLTVMLLCSVLVGKGIVPLDYPLTAHYTVALADVIREYRQSLGMEPTEVVDHPTWYSLIEQPVQP